MIEHFIGPLLLGMLIVGWWVFCATIFILLATNYPWFAVVAIASVFFWIIGSLVLGG